MLLASATTGGGWFEFSGLASQIYADTGHASKVARYVRSCVFACSRHATHPVPSSRQSGRFSTEAGSNRVARTDEQRHVDY